MTSTRAAEQPSPTTLVLHCGDVPAAGLEQHLRGVLRTVPAHVRLVATVLRPVRLSAPLARRVQVTVIADGGTSLVASLVSRAIQVVVVPAGVVLSQGWFQEVEAGTTMELGLVSIFPVGDQHVFAFPADVTDLDARRTAWTPLVNARRAGAKRRAARPGARPATITAVLIVKDEEQDLPSCLASLVPLVDEVVVYDTGSSDATAAIAAASGATVVEGFWDDDFGAARTRALEHAGSEWVLSIDADEVAVADAGELRAWLADADGEQALVTISSTAWKGADAGAESRSVRLFRRARATWAGALHEQVVPREGQAPLENASAPVPLRLLHSGYDAVSVVTKDKKHRNTSVARAALEATPEDHPRWPDRVADLGRSLVFAGEVDEALSLLSVLLDRPASRGNTVQVARVVVPLLTVLGRWQEAEAWVRAGEQHGESRGQLVVWRAAAALGADDPDTAASQLRALLAGGSTAGGADLWGRPFDAAGAVTLLAEVEVLRGRSTEAAELMLDQLQRSPQTVSTAVLFRTLGSAGMTLGELVAAAPRAYVERSLREMLLVPTSTALAWFTALSEADPQDPRPVVAACVVAARSSWSDAAEWSVRARQVGLHGVCALRSLAGDRSRPPLDRGMAWALLAEGFGEEDARAGLAEVLGNCSALEAIVLRDRLAEHVPAALTPSRPSGALV